jgi:hypothetical protein
MELSNELETKEQLEAAVTLFVESDASSSVHNVHQKLRHELRLYLNKYPGRYYHLALSRPNLEGYELTMSKQPIELKWEQLTSKTRKMVEKFTGLKSMDEDLDEFTKVKMWKQLAIDSVLALGCEKDWQNKHYDYESQIHKKLTKSANFAKWIELKLPKDYTQEIKL